MILSLRALTKRFTIHHLEREVLAFENVTLELEAGSFLLVAGPNGVGKSTLLRCLYRSYLPSEGHAYYASRYGVVDLTRAADVDIARLRREEIGFVTQFLRPRPRVSALELVAEPLLAAGGGLERAEREAAHWLDAFGLKRELWRAYPSSFSGGEQQKVNLARALIHPRRLLLLDEPTASLDKQARTALVERLKALQADGVTMIGVFHHPEDVTPLIDTTLELGGSVAGPLSRELNRVAH